MPLVIKLLGRPPLLPGEKVADFHRILEELAREHAPVTFGEWLLLRELTEVIWMRLRFRRAQTGLFLREDYSDAHPLPDFSRPERENDSKPRPVHKSPKFFRQRHRPMAPTDREMGKSLMDKVEIFTRSETMIAALDRRSDLLLQRLTAMKEDRNARSAIIDGKAETLDPHD